MTTKTKTDRPFQLLYDKGLYHIESAGGGSMPRVLKGGFTTITEANRAIDALAKKSFNPAPKKAALKKKKV